MPKKPKLQRITFKSLLRLVIFLTLVFLLINWFGQNQSHQVSNNDPTVFIGETISSSNVLGAMYSKLPKNSQNQFENFNDSDIGKFITNASDQIKNSLNGFPQKQIKEIKKAIIKSISDDMIRNIDEK